MKKLLYSISLFTVALTVLSCEKNEIRNSEYIDAGGQAQLKVMFYSVYRNNPLNQISINGARVSNTLGGATNPTPFPGGGLNTGGASTADYLGVTPGSNKVDIIIPKRGTNVDSVSLATFTGNMDANKKYSLFYTDTAANTTAILVQDTLAQPDSGFSKYIFMNLTPDLPSADLYIGTVKVASAVPYKGISAPFTLPISTATTSTTWAVRAAGGTANLFTYANASTFANRRTFTIASRGYNSVTATTDYRNRKISFIFTR